jgi:hypothetical protein
MTASAKFRIVDRGFERQRRISPQMQRHHTPKSLGNQANFVINFCQILFEPETARIAP